MISRIRTPLISLIVLFLTTSVCMSAEEAPNDKDALRGLTNAKAVFDITTGNPKKLNFYLKLIADTAETMRKEGVTPDFMLSFRGPATRYVSTDDSHVKVEDTEAANAIKQKLAILAKTPNMEMTQCAIAARVLKVDPKTIDPAITVVGNSWITLIAYQNKGYAIVPVR